MKYWRLTCENRRKSGTIAENRDFSASWTCSAACANRRKSWLFSTVQIRNKARRHGRRPLRTVLSKRLSRAKQPSLSAAKISATRCSCGSRRGQRRARARAGPGLERPWRSSFLPACERRLDRLMKVRMRPTRAPLISARLALRRMRFFACGVFAIVKVLVSRKKRARPGRTGVRAPLAREAPRSTSSVSAGIAGSKRSSGRPGRFACTTSPQAHRADLRGHRPPSSSRNSRARRRAGQSRASVDPPASIASSSTSLIAGTSRSSRSQPIRPAGPARRDPREVQRLADVDIAEPGDDALVEQQRLDRRGAPASAPLKIAPSNPSPSGSGPIAAIGGQ